MRQVWDRSNALGANTPGGRFVAEERLNQHRAANELTHNVVPYVSNMGQAITIATKHKLSYTKCNKHPFLLFHCWSEQILLLYILVEEYISISNLKVYIAYLTYTLRMFFWLISLLHDSDAAHQVIIYLLICMILLQIDSNCFQISVY